MNFLAAGRTKTDFCIITPTIGCLSTGRLWITAGSPPSNRCSTPRRSRGTQSFARFAERTGGFSQSGWWAGMRKPDADEFRWNLSTFIAYGFKSISHFCWASPDRVSVEDGGEDMRDHVIDQEGKRTALYEPAVYYNWQIRQLGDFLMGIDCVHAYHSGANTPEGVELLPKNFLLQPKNKSDNFIVSLFTSKDDSEK
ncbi:MAG: hypothetical protein ACLRSW_09720, partial [Christensenellaceae bacterium]